MLFLFERVQVLVTGGAGFIGSNFVRFLLEERDNSVVTLDALTYAGSRNNLSGLFDNPNHRFIEGDIRNRSLVEELVDECDVIVNFAAESHVDRSIEGAKPFISTNVQGTQTLLDAAVEADIDRFLQISTDEVYGEIYEGKFSEDDKLNPRNPYAASKSAADLLVHSYHETHNLPTLITRTCNNFGPRQHSEKLIPKFIERASKGDQLPVYGDGSNVREWIYVKDNCSAVDAVLRNGSIGNIYNIGTNEERTNLEITEAIIQAVGGSKELVEFVDDRPGHDHRYAVEAKKIKDIGWEPEFTFEEGLEQTVEYYLG